MKQTYPKSPRLKTQNSCHGSFLGVFSVRGSVCYPWTKPPFLGVCGSQTLSSSDQVAATKPNSVQWCGPPMPRKVMQGTPFLNFNKHLGPWNDGIASLSMRERESCWVKTKKNWENLGFLKSLAELYGVQSLSILRVSTTKALCSGTSFSDTKFSWGPFQKKSWKIMPTPSPKERRPC